MTGISVIIATLNEAARIGPLIQQLRDQGFSEVIVVDASPAHDTIAAALAAGARVLTCAAPCRGAQLQMGAQAARFDTLFFLHADSQLPIGAYQVIMAALVVPEVIAGSFRLAFDHRHLVLSVCAWCSRINLPITTFGDQGLFVRRAVFERIGGYRPLALLEDYEIQFRLRPQGQFVKLPLSLTTSARRFLRRGIVMQQSLNVAIILAYTCGVNPDRLRAWYQGRQAD